MVTVDLRGRSPQQFANMVADKLATLGIAVSAPPADEGDRAQGVRSARPAETVRGDEESPQRPGLNEAGSGPGAGGKTPRRGLRAVHAVRPRLAIIASVVSIGAIGIVIAIMLHAPTSSPPRMPVSSTPRTPLSSTPDAAKPTTVSKRGNYSDCRRRDCYSIAVSPRSMSGRPYQGARAFMSLIYMRSGNVSSSNAAHINSSLWVIQNSAHDAFMEEGIYDGWVGAKDTWTCTRVNSHRRCTYFIYDPGEGSPSACISSGCEAYIIYWAVTTMAGASENTYFHIVEFTSPSPDTQLYFDDGYNGGEWVVHITSPAGLDYRKTTTINSEYRYIERIEVGGKLNQVGKRRRLRQHRDNEFCRLDTIENIHPFRCASACYGTRRHLYLQWDPTGTWQQPWHVALEYSNRFKLQRVLRRIRRIRAALLS